MPLQEMDQHAKSQRRVLSGIFLAVPRLQDGVLIRNQGSQLVFTSKSHRTEFDLGPWTSGKLPVNWPMRKRIWYPWARQHGGISGITLRRRGLPWHLASGLDDLAPQVSRSFYEEVCRNGMFYLEKLFQILGPLGINWKILEAYHLKRSAYGWVMREATWNQGCDFHWYRLL